MLLEIIAKRREGLRASGTGYFNEGRLSGRCFYRSTAAFDVSDVVDS